jgi:hypothetical protein
MNVISNCVWCKSRYSTTIPELCDDLREAIEEGDEHNALIIAFATELALFQEQWPYCSRRCENDDADYPLDHPEREGLAETLRSIDSLPWAHIQAKAQGLEPPPPPPPRPKPPKLVALGSDDPPPVFEEPDEPSQSIVPQPEVKVEKPLTPAPTASALRLVDSLEDAEIQAQKMVARRRKKAQVTFVKSTRPRVGLMAFGIFAAGLFAGSLLMHVLGIVKGDPLLSVSGSTLIIGGLLGTIAALLALPKS